MNLSAKDKRKMEYHKLCIWYLMRASEIRNELAFAAEDACVYACKKTAKAFVDGGKFIDEERGWVLEPMADKMKNGKYVLYFVDA